MGVSEHVPKSIASSIRKAIDLLRQHQRRGLEALSEAAEAFESAEENQDRFVVLVFGEVNAGKSALANHVAGLDYEDTVSSPRESASLTTDPSEDSTSLRSSVHASTKASDSRDCCGSIVQAF